MPLRWPCGLLATAMSVSCAAYAQGPAPSEPKPGEATTAAARPTTAAPVPEGRTGANLLGQTNTAQGESRRNENVQITLVDTNAARELNTRVGASATIVQEFRPERDYYSSEYGNAAPGPVHVAPVHGSGVHGALFWSHNNSVFNARSFFQVGSVQPARQNQYGAALGLALWRGAFFQFNGSQDKNRGNVNGNVLVPLPEERTPLTTDPAVRAIVEQLIGAYPDVPPNRTDIAARALNTNSLQSTNTDSVSGQLNQSLGGRHALVFRHAYLAQRVDAFQFVRGQNPDTSNRSHTARLSWTYLPGARTVLEASIGFDRQGTLLTPAAGAVGPVYLNGLTFLGPNSNIPLDRAVNRFSYGASLQHNRGQHALTAGFALTRQQYNGWEPDGARTVYQFRDDFGRDMITNLRMGTPSSLTQLFGNAYRGFRNWEVQAYAGGRWSVDSRLQLSLGVRWEPWTRPTEVTGFDDLPFGSDWNNLGGSFGFALRLPKGVLRGAAGVMFGQLFPATYGQDRLNAPANVRISIQAPNLADPFATLTPEDLDPNKARAARFELAPDLATPYSYQYNLSWENEVWRGWRLQLGYVGSRSHKLYFTYQLNRARFVEGVPFNTATTNLRRPDQRLFEHFYTLNGSRAYYDAGRATLTVPRWRRTTLSVSYWFSKSIDLGSDYTVTGGGQEKWANAGQQQSGVFADLKGLSNFDQPHALLVQATYSVPRAGSGWLRKLIGDWEISGVWLLKSGTPFTVEAGSDALGFGNLDGVNGDRPMLMDPSVLGRIVGDPDTAPLLLPRSAFRYMRAPEELRGNLGRNTFRKGKIANVNAALARSWALAGDWSLTFRAESINLTNTPQFAEPGRSLTSPNFGQITNTLNDGRAFRFALRAGF